MHVIKGALSSVCSIHLQVTLTERLAPSEPPWVVMVIDVGMTANSGVSVISVAELLKGGVLMMLSAPQRSLDMGIVHLSSLAYGTRSEGG